MVTAAETLPHVLTYRLGERAGRRRFSLAYGGSLEERETSILVESDLAAVDLFHWRIDGDRLEISADLRRLHRPGMRVDPRGLLSFFTLGMCAPPFSLYREISAFVPGMRTTIDLHDFSMREEPALAWSPLLSGDPAEASDRQTDALLEALDGELERATGSARPVLLFSGGVDSGLLAARLVALGRRDALLVHYSFDDDAPDSVASRGLAASLGLALHVVKGTGGSAAEIIDGAPVRYHRPFADHSAVPTAELMEGALRIAGPSDVLLDGTGADGAFGMFAKAATYDRIDRFLPRPIRRACAAPYALFGYWRRRGRVEYLLRLLRRLGELPPTAAAVAVSPMLGIGFHADPEVRAEFGGRIDRWARALAPSDGPPVRVPITDLACICAGVFAQKDFRLAQDAGVPIAYPFLTRPMIDLAFRRASRWPGAALPKRVLKEALLRSAPPEIVLRPKSGFVSSKNELFRDPAILERIEAVASSGAKLAGVVHARIVRTALADLRAGRDFAPQIYNFLWSLLIAESWLRGIDAAGAALRARDRRSDPPVNSDA